MELHEITPNVPFEELNAEEQRTANEGTELAMSLGEMLFQLGKGLDPRPPVIATAIVFALLRTASEAGRSKEGARKMIDYTIERLKQAAVPGGPLDSMWEHDNKAA